MPSTLLEKITRITIEAVGLKVNSVSTPSVSSGIPTQQSKVATESVVQSLLVDSYTASLIVGINGTNYLDPISHFLEDMHYIVSDVSTVQDTLSYTIDKPADDTAEVSDNLVVDASQGIISESLAAVDTLSIEILLYFAEVVTSSDLFDVVRTLGVSGDNLSATDTLSIDTSSQALDVVTSAEAYSHQMDLGITAEIQNSLDTLYVGVSSTTQEDVTQSDNMMIYFEISLYAAEDYFLGDYATQPLYVYSDFPQTYALNYFAEPYTS